MAAPAAVTIPMTARSSGEPIPTPPSTEGRRIARAKERAMTQSISPEPTQRPASSSQAEETEEKGLRNSADATLPAALRMNRTPQANLRVMRKSRQFATLSSDRTYNLPTARPVKQRWLEVLRAMKSLYRSQPPLRRLPLLHSPAKARGAFWVSSRRPMAPQVRLSNLHHPPMLLSKVQ